MFTRLFVTAREAFLLLRRDRIYVAAGIAGVMFIGLANTASTWSIEDFTKILFDIGAFGFHLTGSLVALFWGAKAISDSRQEGSLDVQLASPVSRPVWLLGKYLGLSACLLLLSVVLVAVWQVFMLLSGYGWLNTHQLVVFAFLTVNWLIVAAVAFCFATFCGAAVALFTSLGVWIVGLCSQAVCLALSQDTPQLTRKIVTAIAQSWDLQRFNLIDLATAASTHFPARADLLERAAYGGSLILLLITLSCVIFSRRDLAVG